MSENDILKIEFLQVNDLMLNRKFNGNVLSCINIYLYVYEICMHMLRYYESLKMCKECICILMIK